MKEYRIHGPPGTGKTTTLRHWIGDAADKMGGDAVVVASFTKAAAIELVRRNLPIPKENVGTLHSLCFHALGSPEIAEGHVKDWNERYPRWMLSRGSGDLDDPYDQSGKTEGDKAESMMQRFRGMQTPHELWPDHVIAFETDWNRWKHQTGLLDFTDLIEHGLETMACAPGAPRVLFIDETQDLAPLELALVRRWGEETDYFVLAGDSQQSIYNFKGATPEAFLTPEIAEDRNRELHVGYRLPRAVHEFAAAWIAEAQSGRQVHFSARDDAGSLERLDGWFTNPTGALRVASEAHRDRRTCMILATCGYMLNNVIAELRSHGLPFHNPYRRKRGQWNPMKGGPQRLAAFLVPATYERPWTWGEIARWAEVVRSEGTFTSGAKTMISRASKKKIAKEDTDPVDGDDEQVEEHEEKTKQDKPISQADLRALFQPDALQELLGSDISAPALLRWLEPRVLASKNKLMEYSMRVAEKHGAGALTATPSITIGTVHSTKGAESQDVVLFPNLSRLGMGEWLGDVESRDCVRRVMYVGATRARERLFLAQTGGQPGVNW